MNDRGCQSLNLDGAALPADGNEHRSILNEEKNLYFSYWYVRRSSGLDSISFTAKFFTHSSLINTDRRVWVGGGGGAGVLGDAISPGSQSRALVSMGERKNLSDSLGFTPAI